MARQREFSESEALEKAMQLFWTSGYHATSTRKIEEALSLGRQSIYNAFGNKESLFHRCLKHYSENVLSVLRMELSPPAAGRPQIVKYIAGTVERFDSDVLRRGCFLVNAVAELALEDEFVLEWAQKERQTTVSLLTAAISNSIQSAEIQECPYPSVVAENIWASESGMSTAARLKSDKKTLVDIASLALKPLF